MRLSKENAKTPEDALSYEVIGAAIEVHKVLGGPGLLESIYEKAMVWELQSRGIAVERQVEVPIYYKGHLLGTPLRVDLLVEKLVILENKSVMIYNPIFEVKTLTYLRLTNLKLGLVINFGEQYVKNGVHRVANNL